MLHHHHALYMLLGNRVDPGAELCFTFLFYSFMPVLSQWN